MSKMWDREHYYLLKSARESFALTQKQFGPMVEVEQNVIAPKQQDGVNSMKLKDKGVIRIIMIAKKVEFMNKNRLVGIL